MINWTEYERLSFERSETNIEEKTYLVVDVDGLFWTVRYDSGIWRNDADDDPIEGVTHFSHINLPGEEDKDEN